MYVAAVNAASLTVARCEHNARPFRKVGTGGSAAPSGDVKMNAVSPPDFDIEQGLLDPPSDRKSLWYRLLNQRAFAMK